MSYPPTPETPEQPTAYGAQPAYGSQPETYTAPQADYAAQYPQQEAQQFAPEQYQQQPSLPTTLAGTNAFALVSVILAFIQPIAGIVFGHIGLNQIKRNGDAGRGLALTGVIVGYIWLVIIALIFIAYIGIIIVAISSAAAGASRFSSSF
ncbi:DUF4190 domain-containing protein [Leucobacter weissii]|uniref:DUF4190 domain-containing protein n=1 Tax=Leucobacter weissii TaxID=1983706 RepID=A0A939SCB8_9MICO|nr:DUF4190 domain-containing protein [Leucobacter weissii]MBO1902203.1 DUF4190 domain-containing protein [Leucobacter weissii]